MFRPNSSLLNASFDGYKLASEGVTWIRQPFQDGVFKMSPSPSHQFSYHHVREATMRNHLAADPWDGHRIYWTSLQAPQKILCGSLLNSGDLIISSVYQFDKASINTVKTNSSLFFLSQSLSLFHHSQLSNGSLILFNTGDRTSIGNIEAPPTWVPLIEISCIDGTVLGVGLSEDERWLNWVIFKLMNTPTDKSCQCYWYRAEISSVARCGCIDSSLCSTWSSTSVPAHCQFIGSHLIIASDSIIVPQGDHPPDPLPLVAPRSDPQVPHEGLGYQNPSNRKYTWSQTPSDITITISTPSDVLNRDIVCNVANDSLVVGLSDGMCYIRGELLHLVDSSISTWSYNRGRLEVTLEKMEDGLIWESLLNDGTGRSERDLPLQDGLNPTATTPNESFLLREGRKGDGSRPVVVQNKMEECDNEDDKDVVIYLMSSDGKIIQKVGLGGKQFLFSLSSLICLRHDVDALLYVPTLSQHDNNFSLSFIHKSTFNALGYVQASKRDKKFFTCNSTCSHAALSNSTRHIFIYSQPTDGISGTTAHQYIHTLNDDSRILGLHFSHEELLYVLLEDTLIVGRLNRH